MMSKSSARVKGKWGLMPVKATLPMPSRVDFRIFGMKPVARTQPPQPLPAVVHFWISGNVGASSFLIASTIWPFVTFWQRQTTASTERSSAPSALLPPRKRSPGCFFSRSLCLDRFSRE